MRTMVVDSLAKALLSCKPKAGLHIFTLNDFFTESTLRLNVKKIEINKKNQ